jgi:thiamine pyrophosphate-dependent acetolactate synthase large subunit-like protein
VVPGDILLETDRGKEPVSAIRRTTTVSRPGADELAEAAAVLDAADRITILAGAGCEGAHAELLEAARVLQAPVVHTLRGKEHIEYDNPFDVGLTGLLGFASGYRAMESCDALLVLGADFPYRDFYPAGVSMLLGDLITLRQHDLPVKVVVFDNNALAFVELEMMSAGIPKWGTDLKNPDFAEVARSVGLFGVRVERPDELRPALQAAFEYDGPALVNVLTRRTELSIPPHVTFKEMKGVSLFAGRTIISGSGDELVDLARDNLR